SEDQQLGREDAIFLPVVDNMESPSRLTLGKPHRRGSQRPVEGRRRSVLGKAGVKQEFARLLAHTRNVRPDDACPPIFPVGNERREQPWQPWTRSATVSAIGEREDRRTVGWVRRHRLERHFLKFWLGP